MDEPCRPCGLRGEKTKADLDYDGFPYCVPCIVSGYTNALTRENELVRQLKRHQFNLDELGTLLGALAAFSQICLKLDEAKEAGIVPPCLELSEDQATKVAQLTAKVRVELARASAN